jgi:hypothetical protein
MREAIRFDERVGVPEVGCVGVAGKAACDAVPTFEGDSHGMCRKVQRCMVEGCPAWCTFAKVCVWQGAGAYRAVCMGVMC